jgi:hypothetical protein
MARTSSVQASAFPDTPPHLRNHGVLHRCRRLEAGCLVRLGDRSRSARQCGHGSPARPVEEAQSPAGLRQNPLHWVVIGHPDCGPDLFKTKLMPALVHTFMRLNGGGVEPPVYHPVTGDLRGKEPAHTEHTLRRVADLEESIRRPGCPPPITTTNCRHSLADA